MAKVAKSNSYKDLDDKPNIEEIMSSSSITTNLLNGSMVVAKAYIAEKSTLADSSTLAENANIACKAIADMEGNDFSTKYIKFSEAKNLSVSEAQKAICDKNGADITNNYCLKSELDTYKNEVKGTYTKQIDFNNFKNEVSDDLKNYAKNEETNQSLNEIKNCFSKSIKVNVRVGESLDGNDSVDLFKDTGTDFDMTALVDCKGKILLSTIAKQRTGAARNNKNYLFLYIEGLSSNQYPNIVSTQSDMFQSGDRENKAWKEDPTSINGRTYYRYNLSDSSYDYDKNAVIILEFS